MNATLPPITNTTPRHHYQHHVAALLEKIDERRHQLLLSRANGTQTAGLQDLETELETARHELAATTAASSQARTLNLDSAGIHILDDRYLSHQQKRG